MEVATTLWLVTLGAWYWQVQWLPAGLCRSFRHLWFARIMQIAASQKKWHKLQFVGRRSFQLNGRVDNAQQCHFLGPNKNKCQNSHVQREKMNVWNYQWQNALRARFLAGLCESRENRFSRSPWCENWRFGFSNLTTFILWSPTGEGELLSEAKGHLTRSSRKPNFYSCLSLFVWNIQNSKYQQWFSGNFTPSFLPCAQLFSICCDAHCQQNSLFCIYPW